jgi:hypothetical protein
VERPAECSLANAAGFHERFLRWRHQLLEYRGSVRAKLVGAGIGIDSPAPLFVHLLAAPVVKSFFLVAEAEWLVFFERS